MAKKTIKKKKSVLPKLLIGAGVIGGGYLLYTKVIKPYMDANKDVNTTPDETINKTVSAASSTTPNIPSTSAANVFSPMGTAWGSLKKDIPITYGSKGQEVLTMQKLINKILKNQGWTTRIAEDGDFGKGTWNVHKGLSFKAQNLDWWWNASEKGIPGIAPKGVANASTTISGTFDGGSGSSALIGFGVAGVPGAIVGGAYDWLYGGN
jgi:hypothetical protein